MVGLFKKASRNVRFLPPHVSVAVWLIQTTDIPFPRNRKGSCKPLKTLWKSTMGVQSVDTDASVSSDPLQALRILIWLLRVIGQTLRIHPIEYTDTTYQLD